MTILKPSLEGIFGSPCTCIMPLRSGRLRGGSPPKISVSQGCRRRLALRARGACLPTPKEGLAKFELGAVAFRSWPGENRPTTQHKDRRTRKGNGDVPAGANYDLRRWPKHMASLPPTVQLELERSMGVGLDMVVSIAGRISFEIKDDLPTPVCGILGLITTRIY